MIEPGEDLSIVADRTCIPIDELIELNPNLDPQLIQVGSCVDLRRRRLQGAGGRVASGSHAAGVAALAVALRALAGLGAGRRRRAAARARARRPAPGSLVDAGDGEVLAARRPARSYPVASTTKLMTAYVARGGARPRPDGGRAGLRARTRRSRCSG